MRMYHIRFYVVYFINFNDKRFNFLLIKYKFPIIAITRNHFAINGTTQGPALPDLPNLSPSICHCHAVDCTLKRSFKVKRF